MGRRKKKTSTKARRVADCIERLNDGRYRIRVRSLARGQDREVQETLEHGASEADAVARRDEIREALAHGGPTKPAPPPTLRSYSKSWLATRSRRVRKATATTYAKILGRYVLPHLGSLRVDDIRRRDLEGWLGWLERDSGLALRSQRSAWRYGLMVIRDACADLHLPDPSLRLQGPRGREEQAGRSLSAEQLGLLVAAARQMCLARESGVITLCYTGLRSSELRYQLRADLDLGPEAWLVCSHSKTLGGKGRRVPLPEVVREVLTRHLAAAPESLYVWPGARTGKPVGRHWCAEIVAHAAERAGLGHLTPHDLRRTYISLLHRAQVDRLAVQSIVGHSQNKTTDGYVHLTDEDRRAALKVLPGGAQVGLAGGT